MDNEKELVQSDCEVCERGEVEYICIVCEFKICKVCYDESHGECEYCQSPVVSLKFLEE